MLAVSQLAPLPTCRYNSTSYYDDMTWAASWMYQATGQATYLNDAITFYVQHSQVRLHVRTNGDASCAERTTKADLALANMHSEGCGLDRDAGCRHILFSAALADV